MTAAVFVSGRQINVEESLAGVAQGVIAKHARLVGQGYDLPSWDGRCKIFCHSLPEYLARLLPVVTLLLAASLLKVDARCLIKSVKVTE